MINYSFSDQEDAGEPARLHRGVAATAGSQQRRDSSPEQRVGRDEVQQLLEPEVGRTGSSKPGVVRARPDPRQDVRRENRSQAGTRTRDRVSPKPGPPLPDVRGRFSGRHQFGGFRVSRDGTLQLRRLGHTGLRASRLSKIYFLLQATDQ